MNNKGQSLIIFVLILPILLLLFALIFELGNYGLTINKYEKEKIFMRKNRKYKFGKMVYRPAIFLERASSFVRIGKRNIFI